MPQVEGIITEELYCQLYSRNKAPDTLESRFNAFEDRVKSEKVGPLTLKILDSLVSFLKDSNLYKKFKWTEEDTGINRNATLHGKDCSFNTCANSIRMILLLDSIYWIFCTLESARRGHTT